MFVTSDLTKKEMEVSKKLKEELKRCKRADESNLTTRGGHKVRMTQNSTQHYSSLSAIVDDGRSMTPEAAGHKVRGMAVTHSRAGGDHSVEPAQLQCEGPGPPTSHQEALT